MVWSTWNQAPESCSASNFKHTKSEPGIPDVSLYRQASITTSNSNTGGQNHNCPDREAEKNDAAELQAIWFGAIVFGFHWLTIRWKLSVLGGYLLIQALQ